MSRRAGERESGMTLVEAVVVVTLLGVLSVAVAPLFSGADRVALWRVSRGLASDLRFAQEYAMQHGVATTVEMDARSGRYRIVETKTGESVLDPLLGSPFVVDAKGESNVSWPEDVRVEYTASGYAAAPFSIPLRHPSGDSLVVQVAAESGLVRIVETLEAVR